MGYIMEYKLTFGEHIGKRLSEVPLPYLQWLTHWHKTPRHHPEHPRGIVLSDASLKKVYYELCNVRGIYELPVNKSRLPEGNALREPAWWDGLQAASDKDKIMYVWNCVDQVDAARESVGWKTMDKSFREDLYTWINHREAVIAARDAFRARFHEMEGYEDVHIDDSLCKVMP